MATISMVGTGISVSLLLLGAAASNTAPSSAEVPLSTVLIIISAFIVAAMTWVINLQYSLRSEYRAGMNEIRSDLKSSIDVNAHRAEESARRIEDKVDTIPASTERLIDEHQQACLHGGGGAARLVSTAR